MVPASISTSFDAIGSDLVLDYCLRINHHGKDHADLILEGIRPGILAARASCPGLAVALRSHWLHGPHLLVGVEARDASQQQKAISLIGEHALAWMRQNPSQPITDLAGYRRKSLALAEAENLSIQWDELRPTDSIGPADYAVPDFLDDPKLSEIRDWFAASALDDIFGVIELKRASEPAALARTAVLFLLIEQLRGPPMLDFWPMSLQAQVETTRTAAPDVYSRLDAAAERLLPLVAVGDERKVPEEVGQSSQMNYTHWIGNLSKLQQTVEHYVEGLDDGYFVRLEAQVAGRIDESDKSALSSRLKLLSRSRLHFSYRIFMNMLYVLLPVAGLSAWKRILVGALLVKWLRLNNPKALDDVKYHAKQLVDNL